jgi:hypothetical protein
VAKQKIRSVLIPEFGITLEPRGVVESVVDTDFIRALAHLVAMSPAGPVLLNATTGRDLRVAVVGVGFEVYEVNAGVAPDAYNVAQTYIFVLPQYVTDCLIETFGATIEFMNQAGVWGDPKSLPVGFYSFDFLHYGIRIQNRVALSVCNFEFTTYR